MTGLPRCLALALVAATMLAATDAAAVTMAGFGRCLKSKGATFYGASWCPYCDRQRETLGDAMDYVRYVECSADGARGESTAACRKADVDSYPTWTFSDGSRADGAQSLGELAEQTGCDLPRDADR
jgi:thiol-disulfide isomerase/thioredoxin